MHDRTHDLVWKMVFTLLGVAIIPQLCSAQGAGWDGLRQLAQGQKVKVELNDGKSYQGTFQSVSDEAVVVNIKAGSRTFGQPDIRRVLSKTGGHRGRHVLLGTAIGAGVGLGIGAAVDNGCTKSSIVCTGNAGKAIGTPLFAALGAAIGAILPSGGWHEVYRK